MTESSSTRPATTPAPGTYRLDPDRTAVRVDGKGMFGLIPVHGTVRLVSGEVTIADAAERSSVRAVIDATSYSSGNSKRDKDVTSPNLIDAKAYPEITFTGEGARAQGNGWVVPGTVTAHGVPVPTELTIDDVRTEDGAVRFHAVATLDRTQFSVTKMKAMVGRKVVVIIDAAAVPGQ
jgi:polyisoprenoid-binding protein YceI